MSLVEKIGDLFTSDTDAIGHGVNCKGLMGAGIAKAFRAQWPEMYHEYRMLCEAGLLEPGQIFPWNSAVGPSVVNIATQEWPGRDAQYEWVDAGIHNALAYCRDRGLDSLAVPRIGCGIGGLDWELVRDALEVASVEYPGIKLEVWTLPEAS